MSEYSKGLLETEFWNKKGKEVLEVMSKKERKKFIKRISDEEAQKYADEEIAEEANVQPQADGKMSDYFPTGYPSPVKRYWLMNESYNTSLEEMYYWILSQLRRDQGYHMIYKLTDIFSASEQSAFWGAAQARLKIQQETVSQYLIAIGKLVRELFQIVRELRIIDERLVMYDLWKELKSADISLKGLYIDMVEGASKNPSSVYGLAQQVGFTILPDLFFNTHVYKAEEVDKVVDATKYNQAIKNVLKRKLLSFVIWKEKTGKELKDRRKFQLKYLRQHWAVIKMYMDWLKPYLRNIRRMQMSEKQIESADIVSAFETSMTEVEFMAVKPSKTGAHPVIVASFEYRTKPDLSFHQDQYAHKGPIHIGRASMKLRIYGWTDKQIENYKKLRREESMKLFSVIDGSVKAAMEALGEELELYLKQAGEDIEETEKEEKKVKKPKNLGMLDPFVAVVKGVFDLIGALLPSGVFETEAKKPTGVKKPTKSQLKKASGVAIFNAWQTYKNYKKGHQMLSW
ncbi:MAG: hypothetical protein KKF89_06185 [Nanoarchaeota archaeon]|nr:hypothetical protein [Nanoarchaeota archaeon]MBU1855288.1 hypothetical protein [Nanoarchaeota archaeon]